MSCDCVNLVIRLTFSANEITIKIHDAEGEIMRHQVSIMKVEMEFSDDPTIKAKQMHQIAEIKVRIARRRAQIARLTVELIGLDAEIMNAIEAARRCQMDDYASAFAGRGFRVRNLNLDDLNDIFGSAVNMDDVVDAMRRP